ncbi:MAG: ferredoxin [Magnetococcales bacterium]|nr:ferredoxin [Magnetococcales bacterium]
MAYAIHATCVTCWACLPECPNDAIHERGGHLVIDPVLCTECTGDHLDPQCASICPVEEAIVDATGTPLNPLGSLTGVPAQVRLAYTAAHESGGWSCLP